MDSREDDELAEIKLTYSILDDINQARPAFGRTAVCIIQVQSGDLKPGDRLLEVKLDKLLGSDVEYLGTVAQQLSQGVARITRDGENSKTLFTEINGIAVHLRSSITDPSI